MTRLTPRRVRLAFTSRQAFHHVLIANGPLWWLCGDCRALRRDP